MAIAKTVWKGSLSEAEERDNQYWSSLSAEERLQALIELRAVFFANAKTTIDKVVFKRKLNEKTDNKT